jgi:DNA-binding CsgD family transcriptional regulator
MAAESNRRRGRTFSLAEADRLALSPKEARALCLLADDGYSQRELAMIFEVSTSTVGRITRGER